MKTLCRLSQPTKAPPGLRTRHTSRSSWSCNAGDGTWCSIVNAAHPENSASGNGIEVASPFTTSTLVPRSRTRSNSARVLIGFNCGQARQCRSQTVRRKPRARTPPRGRVAQARRWRAPMAPAVPASFSIEPSHTTSDAVDSRVLLHKNSCDMLRLAVASVARLRYCDNKC